jgi:hypothetical protein
MANYYKNVIPSEAHLYFSESILKQLQENLKSQILNKEKANLQAGEGIYIFEDGQKKSNLNIAMHVRWVCNPELTSVEALTVLQYHLFSGEMPDELLDEFNKLQIGHNPEWKHYE